jgi:DNA invertase Pin-like site-specific DNA recombinase
MAMMRAAIYARVSTKGVGRQDAENQLRQLRAFAVSQSWTMAHEFVDRQSAKTADREQFQLMSKSASVRGFDVLLFWSPDRLSREGTVATLNHLQRLNSYGLNTVPILSSTLIQQGYSRKRL